MSGVARAHVVVSVAALAVAACAGSDSATTSTATTPRDPPASAATAEVFRPRDDPPRASTPTATTAPTGASTTSTSAAAATTSTSSTTSTTTSSTTTSSTIAIPALSPCPPTGSHIWENRPASGLLAPPLPDGWTTESIGTSARGRDLTAMIRPVDEPIRTVVVIGGIHGNEPVSPPAVRAMVNAVVPDDLELWLVPLLNPDGSAAGTRCNANGVDLNRNFSWNWRASTGGPAPFSEPEPAAARDLVERLDPDLVVWVHQPLDYVSSIGPTPDAYEEAWATGSGLPVRPDVTQHGGGESWTAFVAGIPSMLVEVDSWSATPEMVDAQLAGLNALLPLVLPR